MPRLISVTVGTRPSEREDLVPEVDQPGADNTGVLPGITRQTVGTQTITSGGTLGDPLIIENLDITGRLIIRAPYVTVRNFRVLGGSSISGNGMIDCTNAACVGIRLEDFEVFPSTPHWSWNGVQGHDYTALRGNIYGMTDGFRVFNLNITDPDNNPYQTGVVIQQCWIHDLGWYTAASAGTVHNSDTETHNDLIQHQGGGGSIIRGNRMDAYYKREYAHWQVTGDPNVEPYTTVPLQSLPAGAPTYGGPFQNIPNRGTGTEATGRYNYDDLKAIEIGDEVGYSHDLHVLGNWVRGGFIPINGGGNANPGGGAFLGEFLRNKFGRDAGAQGSGGNTTYTISFQGAGWTAANANIPTSGANANTYIDNGAFVTVRY